MASTNFPSDASLPAERPLPQMWSGVGGKWRRRFAAHVLARRWFDRFSAWALRRFFFPTSRLWAAAELADGSTERFYEAIAIPRRREDSERLEAALARFQKARARAAALETEWQRVFFAWD